MLCIQGDDIINSKKVEAGYIRLIKVVLNVARVDPFATTKEAAGKFINCLVSQGRLLLPVPGVSVFTLIFKKSFSEAVQLFSYHIFCSFQVIKGHVQGLFLSALVNFILPSMMFSYWPIVFSKLETVSKLVKWCKIDFLNKFLLSN